MSDAVKPLTREKLEESAAAFEEMGYTVHVTGRFLRELVATAKQGVEDTARLDCAEENELDIQWQADYSGAICGVAILNVDAPSVDSVHATLRIALDAARVSTSRSGRRAPNDEVNNG